MELLAFLALVERLVSVVRPERPDSKVLQVSVVSLVLAEPLVSVAHLDSAEPLVQTDQTEHLVHPASAEPLASVVLRGRRDFKEHQALAVCRVSVERLALPDQTALLGHPVSAEPLVLRERQEHLGTVAHRAPVTCSHQHQPFSLERA